MRTIFCHGLESGPIGRKTEALRAAGISLETPDFRGLQLSARVALLHDKLTATKEPFALIGSSYGGITAAIVAMQCVNYGPPPVALLLLAPALGRREPPADQLELRAVVPTTIIHGTSDTVVPIAVSRRFAAANPTVELLEVDDDHRLTKSLQLIVECVRALPQAPIEP